jgi:tetratricopeptide (TPR) repeat protein
MKRSRLVRQLAALLTACALSGCAASNQAEPESPLVELRAEATRSSDAEVVGRWLLAELFSPGGEPARAVRARARLDEIGGATMLASLARAFDDHLHGRLRSAPLHYLKAAEAARDSNHPAAPLFAWYGILRARQLEHNVAGLYDQHEAFVLRAIEQPRSIGWRARTELVEWWAEEQYARAKPELERMRREQHGCLEHVRIAGPFGSGSDADTMRRFPPEDPGPWRAVWEPSRDNSRKPHVIKTRSNACLVLADEPAPNGIYYAETYFDVPVTTEVIVAAQGAVAVWVNDALVLDRSPRKWGVWPKFGVALRLTPGRHRVLVRSRSAMAAVRVLHPDGRPLGAPSSADGNKPYSLVPPVVLSDPNVLAPYIGDKDVVDPGDDVLRLVAGHLASTESQSDVASRLIEPLVAKPERATGPSLSMASRFVQLDPIFDDSTSEDLARELAERAVAKDQGLWQARLDLAVDRAAQAGAIEVIDELRSLARAFPEASAVNYTLAGAYSELGWTVEHNALIKEIVERFPEHTEALQSAVRVYEAEGAVDKVSELVARIKKLDADSEIELYRALGRQDYAAALAELRRIGERRPERKDIAERIHDVMMRAGNTEEAWKKLEAAIAQDPRDVHARLHLADARFAKGEQGALRRALVDAVGAGAWTGPLKDALDLVEGVSELEPYRIPALPVIKAYEASSEHLPGTAARVLDYAATWINADGSSRMLEHEVIRIQSAEAIQQFAEHPRLDGLVLHFRVIKKDGRIFEPEDVHGKPTSTLPHLEVGDYIETEHIVSRASQGEQGTEYEGPHWYFREENIAYARSEFVVISPKSRKLVVETRGDVPKPEVTDQGSLLVHRWRVDRSPAAPVEPNSAPVSEFLPSVRIGWGVSLERRLRRLSDALAPTIPIDPRVRDIARRIVGDGPAGEPMERAQRLYRWVLENVEQGDETDGRRVIVGRSGNRWQGFMTLCEAVGIDTSFVLARNRLAPEPRGPLSRASLYTDPVLRVRTGNQTAWVWLGSRYTPFGYIPAEVRDMPAYLLTGEEPTKAKTPAGGIHDRISYTGSVALRADGSALVELSQGFHGKYAIMLREAVAELPERQLRDAIESRLLAPELQGARLLSYELGALEDLDAPLVIRTKVEVKSFAQRAGKALVISPPFNAGIQGYARLPARQTPLLIGEALDQEVKLRIELPEGMKLTSMLKPRKLEDQTGSVVIADRLDGGVLFLDRKVEMNAGRVQPADYPRFALFVRSAGDATAASLRLEKR